MAYSADPYSTLENELRHALRTGSPLVRSAVPHGARVTPDEEAIPAELLRSVLIDRTQDADPRGLRILGARIVGDLDLQNSTLRHAMTFVACDITGWVDLSGARAEHDISFRHARLAGLRARRARIDGQLDLSGAIISTVDPAGNAVIADGLQVTGDAILDDGFEAAGAVHMAGAAITGQFSLSGAKIAAPNSHGIALNADKLQVARSLFGHEGFEAAGAVYLVGAVIGGQLSLRGARITAADKNGLALFADKMQVSAGVFLDDGFRAAGAVRLGGSDIAGQLNLRGAEIAAAGGDLVALFADGLHVDGSAFLDEGFRAAGAIRLIGAHIAGQLSLRGARITACDADGNAIVADGLRVTGSAMLDRGLQAAGAVRLMGATVTGELALGGARHRGADSSGIALIADRLKVDENVRLDGFEAAGAVHLMDARIAGQLSLSDSRITAADLAGRAVTLQAASADALFLLPAACAGWVDLSSIRVTDLVGPGIRGHLPTLWSAGGWSVQRLRGAALLSPPLLDTWLATTPSNAGFSAQPWYEAATVFDRAGRPDHAQWLRRRAAEQIAKRTPKRSRWWRVLYGWVAGHGYQPWCAPIWLGAVYLAALAVVLLGDQQCHFTRNTQNGPGFVPGVYALEIAIPALPFGQATTWSPQPGLVWLIGSLTALKVAGWILTAITVAGSTGILRKA